MGNFVFSVLTEKEKELPYVLYGVGAHWEQETITRPFGYPAFQWIQTIKGEGKAIIDGQEFIINEDHAAFIYPEVPHEYEAISGQWITSWFSFGGYHIENLLHTIGIDTSGIYSIANPGIFDALINKVLTILKSDNNLKNVEGSAMVYNFLMELFKYVHKVGDESFEHQHTRLKPVFDFIEQNYPGPITIEELAQQIHVTPQHFCLLFKNLVQARPFEYINNFRINKGKALLLRDSTLRISEIASMVGYESESYFGSTFKKLEGISPRKFREIHRL